MDLSGRWGPLRPSVRSTAHKAAARPDGVPADFRPLGLACRFCTPPALGSAHSAALGSKARCAADASATHWKSAERRYKRQARQATLARTEPSWALHHWWANLMADSYTPMRSGCEVNLQKFRALFIAGLCRGGCRVLRKRRRSRVALHIMAIPGEVALQAVFYVGRNGELVIFAGIDHKLRVASERLQRLIHLLAAENRHIPINVAAHEERRRGDIFHAVKRRDLVPNLRMLPRVAKFHVVVLLILVVAVKTREFGCARSGDGCLEAIGLSDNEVGRDSSVRPAAYAELIRVGNALRDGIVRHR